MFLLNVFNTFVYDHTLLRGKKYFCRYCLQAFSTDEKLKRHFKDWFLVNNKQRIIIHKKHEDVKFKNHDRKIKSPFITYADFESILVPEDNAKQNPDEFYTNKHQEHVTCSYVYKLVCVDDKFNKPFKIYLGEGPV